MLRMNNRIALGSNLGKSIGNGTTNRYFTSLTSGDYFAIPSFSMTDDFSVDFEFTVNTQIDFQSIFGHNSTANFLRFGTIAQNRFAIAVDGTFLNFSNSLSPLLDGKLHKGVYERVGNDFNIYIDGVLFDTITNATAGAKTLTVSQIGAQNSVNSWDGVLANVLFYDHTISTTIPIRDYKIDEDLSATSTIIDSGSDGSNGTAVSITSSEIFTLEGADWMGANIWTHGNVSAVAAASGFVGASSVTAISGLRYKFYYDVANYVNGSTVASITAVGISRTANGSYTDIITATGISAGWIVTTNPTTLDIENGIIKRILQAP